LKKLNAASTKLSITDDTANSKIDIDVLPSNIAISSLSGAGALAGKDTAAVSDLDTAARTVAIVFVIDGGGSAITTGIKGDLTVPFDCTIVSATLLADQSGSIAIDVWKDSFASYPPTSADSITASAKPALSSAAKSRDTTLTGWTTSVSAGQTLRFNVDSAATLTRVTLILEAVRA
jgi:hypothetical protein